MAALRAKLRDYFHVEYKPGEKQLVRKIDFFILTFCCLSYFTNYVSSNIVARKAKQTDRQTMHGGRDFPPRHESFLPFCLSRAEFHATGWIHRNRI